MYKHFITLQIIFFFFSLGKVFWLFELCRTEVEERGFVWDLGEKDRLRIEVTNEKANSHPAVRWVTFSGQVSGCYCSRRNSLTIQTYSKVTISKGVYIRREFYLRAFKKQLEQCKMVCRIIVNIALNSSVMAVPQIKAIISHQYY